MDSSTSSFKISEMRISFGFFIIFSIWSIFLHTVFLDEVRNKTSNKQKTFIKVNQKNIKCSWTEYVTWTCLNFWLTKNIFWKLFTNNTLVMAVYKFTENNCRSRLFVKFIQAQKEVSYLLCQNKLLI